jgi:hypothetical protein
MRVRATSFAIALAAAIGAALAGCGGARWTPVESVTAVDFADGSLPIGAIDLLPLDLQVWSHDARRDPATVLGALDEIAAGAIAVELGARGYAVGARLEHGGGFVGPDGAWRPAMARAALGETLDALSSYGSAETQAAPGTLLVPYLPHRLGEATGGDATLYVGGWAFAGEPPRSRGGKVARAVGYVALALVAAVVIVAVVAVVRDGDALDGIGDLGGAAAKGVGQVAAGTLRVAGRVAGVAARAVVHAGQATVRVAAEVSRSISIYDVVDLTRAALETAEAMAPPPTHVAIVATRPNWFARPGAPRRGGSRMMLELTLIDNHTGRALWHARQELAADPTKPDDVARVVRHLLRSLPAR